MAHSGFEATFLDDGPRAAARVKIIALIKTGEENYRRNLMHSRRTLPSLIHKRAANYIFLYYLANIAYIESTRHYFITKTVIIYKYHKMNYSQV